MILYIFSLLKCTIGRTLFASESEFHNWNKRGAPLEIMVRQKLRILDLFVCNYGNIKTDIKINMIILKQLITNILKYMSK